jgi:hypothetical protein
MLLPRSVADKLLDLSGVGCNSMENKPNLAPMTAEKHTLKDQEPRNDTYNVYEQEDYVPDVWEQGADFDEEIEPAERGSRDGFELSKTDGANLGAPLLLDLLSDEPIEGVVVRGARLSHLDKCTPSDKSQSGARKLAAKSFKF